MKHLFLSVVFVLICLLSNAQINRTIWGCTLGKSTKQQVKTQIINRGYKISEETIDMIQVSDDNAKFGGINWTLVQLSFVDGLLYRISFIDLQSYSETMSNYEQIGLAMYEKYGEFYILPTLKDKSTLKQSEYIDSNTFVQLNVSHDDGDNYYFLYLVYADINLNDKKLQNEKDEL